MQKVRVGIMGAAGYTGGELLRLLIRHPLVEIIFAQSRSNAGHEVCKVHRDLLGDIDLQFSDKIDTAVDVIFLCLAHGEAAIVIDSIPEKIKVIDLSQDFRIESKSARQFVYGLPELHKENIRTANNIANPGCFATAIQLALLPLAEQQLLKSRITVNCTTGSTGAGQTLSESSHFSWRQNNLSVYKAFTHQHLLEICNSVRHLQPSFGNNITMLPQRGSFTRGILAAICFECDLSQEVLVNYYESFYKKHPFVVISKNDVDLKQVVNTNKCFLQLQVYDGQVLVTSVIDNLLKGASGQAVQNMNLLFGLEETLGLKLKASAF